MKSWSSLISIDTDVRAAKKLVSCFLFNAALHLRAELDWGTLPAAGGAEAKRRDKFGAAPSQGYV